jgi:hypothetical protein
MPRTPEIGVSYLPVSSRRQRIARRRLYLVAALASLAMVSAVTGALTRGSEPSGSSSVSVMYQ